MTRCLKMKHKNILARIKLLTNWEVRQRLEPITCLRRRAKMSTPTVEVSLKTSCQERLLYPWIRFMATCTAFCHCSVQWNQYNLNLLFSWENAFHSMTCEAWNQGIINLCCMQSLVIDRSTTVTPRNTNDMSKRALSWRFRIIVVTYMKVLLISIILLIQKQFQQVYP